MPHTRSHPQRPSPATLAGPLCWASALLLGLALACSGPATRPDPDPVDATDTELAPDPTHATPPSDRYDGWQWAEHAEVDLRLALPADWLQRQADGMFFANPPPPHDDTVLLLLPVQTGALDQALARLDDAFPMKSIRYKERNRAETIHGLDVMYGEGVGFSEDFQADLHFFIMVVDASPHTVLIAAYVREAAFERRKPDVLGIIQSLERR